MPTGTPHNSFALPYRIKVDDFTTHIDQDKTPALHLLTHTHSDHINGLSAKSFGHVVVCSHDAKEMLLRHEVYAERELRGMDLRAERVKTFAHLKIDPIHQTTVAYYQGSRDLLKPISLHKPTPFELVNEEQVVITALDANHCPGSVMYLIEGSKGTVLHTGDFRAEPWFLESLGRNPFLQPYLSSSTAGPLHKALDCIYLDTACVFSSIDIPAKHEATAGLIDLMKLFPPSVYFYINSWTWGYEDILKAVAKAFQAKIHVDCYKYNIYTNISDPYMRLIVTRDPTLTRFHACERFHRCDHVWVDNEDTTYDNVTSRLGKRVVYINPITMSSPKWQKYLHDTRKQIVGGASINNLLVPLSRHSTLPELRAFVSLFRPKRIVPNTLDPRLQEFDWFCIDRMFEGCISSSATPRVKRLIPFQSSNLDEDEDVTLRNLIGCAGVAEMVIPWAHIDSARRKLEVARRYLKTPEQSVIDRALPVGTSVSFPTPPPPIVDRRKKKSVQELRYDSDDETDDDDDQRGRTAHKLFASLADVDGKYVPSPLSSPCSSHGEPQASPTTATYHHLQLSNPVLGDFYLDPHPLTPISSPIWPVNKTPRRILQLKTPTPTHQSRGFFNRQVSQIGKAGKVLVSPIYLEHSPLHTILPSPELNLKLNVPEKYAMKSPLAEQTNRTSLDADLFSIYSHLPGPSDSLSQHQSESSRLHAVVEQMSNCNSTKAGHQGIGHKSLPKIASLHDVSLRRSLRLNSISPQTRARRTHSRIKIGERLAQSRPDAVAPSYLSKREKLLARYFRLETEANYTRTAAEAGERAALDDVEKTQGAIGHHRNEPTMLSFDVTDDDDGDMDWDRSCILADAIRAAIVSGQTITLPPLKCADSQSSEYAFR